MNNCERSQGYDDICNSKNQIVDHLCLLRLLKNHVFKLVTADYQICEKNFNLNSLKLLCRDFSFDVILRLRSLI
jgi:hypothetical protein